ncbi:MAG: molybdopterin-dependent oxidoreductase [Bacteroidales bacterium]
MQADGSIWKIVGNDADQHSNGRFCPRGTGGIGMYYDEDRLKKPLIRTVKEAGRFFREATWDEALEHVSSNLSKIIREHGPESVALFTHGSGSSYYTTLFKALGSVNIAGTIVR